MRDDLLGMLIHEATRALARAVWRPLNAYLPPVIQEGRIYGHETQRADGATVYGHTTPTRPTPSYLRDYHNDDIQT